MFHYYLRVRYAECDAQKVVFNTRYSEYVDVAMNEFLRAIGFDTNRLLASGLDFQLVKQTIEWKAPARFDDVLDVHTRCVGLRGARFRYEYAVVRDDGVLVAEGHTEHACVDAETLRPTRVPDWLSAAVAAAESSSSLSSASSSTT